MRAPIRTGLVGFGLAGRVFHAPLIGADDRFSLECVVTADPGRAAAAAQVARRVVPDLDTLLADRAGLDLLVIASPPSAHARQARAGLSAGLAVVVDKPFVPTVAEGEELIGLADRSGLRLTVFQSRRWDGDFLTVREVVASGALGAVHRFESAFERWQPTLRVAWHGDLPARQGGGTLYDAGCHLIDQALCLFGPARLAWARLARLAQRSEDEAVVVLEHQGGTVSYLSVSRLAAQTGPRFRVLGARAGYVGSGLDPQEAQLKAGLSPTDPRYGLAPPEQWGRLGTPGDERSVPTRRGDYPQFYSLLAEALLDGGPLPVDPASSLETIRIIEEAHRRGG